MNVNVGKWGNSLAIRIPGAVAKDLGIEDGSRLDLQLDEGSLVLKPLREAAKSKSLRELVSKITNENRHAPIDWGAPAGREEW